MTLKLMYFILQVLNTEIHWDMTSPIYVQIWNRKSFSIALCEVHLVDTKYFKSRLPWPFNLRTLYFTCRNRTSLPHNLIDIRSNIKWKLHSISLQMVHFLDQKNLNHDFRDMPTYGLQTLVVVVKPVQIYKIVQAHTFWSHCYYKGLEIVHLKRFS